ncbi:T9SS type B sorting domain-containing protein [Joostella sp. CR20]|uniref:T9SS type B sorting domain-containing protein n=1 Tax=Joostella sp. CR20 TaxID=2804312 RepID=UPI00313BF0B1
MKSPTNHLTYLFLLFVSTFFAQTPNTLPNDCVNAVTVCESTRYSSNAAGIGIQEINTNNSCSSMEHNSYWLKISIVQNGTLGFILRPDNPDINVDYDFFIYGPNATCTSLGYAIRCSTTNPMAAGQSNNLTGLNETSIETSEGPGRDGDSFVKWLDVKVGESYYIVIDRPIGDGGFSIEWTGSTTVGKSPFPPAPTAAKIADQNICNTSGSETFDLNNFKSQINSDPANKISFFDTEANANDNISPLSNIQLLSEEEKTIYVRVTNPNGCFSITDFKISAYSIPETNDIDLSQCDLDNNSTDKKTRFNLLQAIDRITPSPTNTVFFYKSITDRNADTPITTPENYFATDQDKIYIKTVSPFGCSSEGTLTLNVVPTLASLQEIGPFHTCEDMSGITPVTGTFNLKDIKEVYFKNLDVALYESKTDASLENNKITTDIFTTENITLYARIENSLGCESVKQFDLIVDKKPIVNLPKNIPLLCLNNPSIQLEADSGFDQYEWVKVNSDGSTITISNNRKVIITSPGMHQLVISNNYYDATGTTIINSCSNVADFNISASNVATFTQEPLIEDISDNNRITVFVNGEGNYTYAIDNAAGPYQTSNVLENVPKGFSTIYVKDENGCGIVDKTISVIGYDKFFTPNEDNYNDYWKIYGINATTQANTIIYIYDRYGKLLKQLHPLDQGWDGTFNGIPLPASDYWFTVKLEDGRDFKGHFTLKR